MSAPDPARQPPRLGDRCPGATGPSRPRRSWPRPRALIVAVAVTLSPAACSASGSTGPAAPAGARSDWASVVAAARDQQVNWYMYGGDDKLNSFVTGYVADQLKSRYRITLNQVKLTDTVDAVNKVLAEKQAGRTIGGSVDAIWVNGENFATGVQAHLWYCGYPDKLPNAGLVDSTLPAVAADFGLPVNGCESPWQQANSAVVYNSAALSAADAASPGALFAWAKAHPGRFTYPAPPDFTGSMVVRTIFYDTNGGPGAFAGAFNRAVYAPAAAKTWARLNDLKPALWRAGSTYPQSQADTERLFSEGTIDAFLTYGPGAVAQDVAQGTFPTSTREAVFDGGNIGNYSFIAIPDNAGHKAAATVLANLLLSPGAQLQLYKTVGAFPAISLDRGPPAFAQQLNALPQSPNVVTLPVLLAHTLPELQAQYVTTIEADWKTNVLQK